MTYYPSDCPNTPQVFGPDALSFLGGGGSGVALREARGLHRTAKLLELERRDAPLLRLHSLFPRGKDRMALEAERTRTGSHKVHESNGWGRAEAIFYVQMNRFYVGQVFGKRLASGCGDRARAKINDDLFAGHRPYQSSHEKNVY